MGRSNNYFIQGTLFPLAGQHLQITHPDIHVPTAAKIDNRELPNYLYHGSASSIKPGDSIISGGPMSRNKAFASSDPAVAKHFAGIAAAGRITDLNGQYVLWGVSHKVTPNSELLQDVSHHGLELESYLSKSFKVEEPTHLVDEHGNSTPVSEDAITEHGTGTLSNHKYFKKYKQQSLPLELKDEDGND